MCARGKALIELTHRGRESAREGFGIEGLHQVTQVTHRKASTNAFLLLRLR